MAYNGRQRKGDTEYSLCLSHPGMWRSLRWRATGGAGISERPEGAARACRYSLMEDQKKCACAPSRHFGRVLSGLRRQAGAGKRDPHVFDQPFALRTHHHRTHLSRTGGTFAPILIPFNSGKNKNPPTMRVGVFRSNHQESSNTCKSPDR